MASISYLLELTTKIPITLDESDFNKGKPFFEVILEKAQEVIDYIDMNDQEFRIAVVSETREI